MKLIFVLQRIHVTLLIPITGEMQIAYHDRAKKWTWKWSLTSYVNRQHLSLPKSQKKTETEKKQCYKN